MLTRELHELCLSITDCHHSTPLYTSSGNIVIRNYNIKDGRLLLDDVSYTDDQNLKIRTSRAIPEEGDIVITREAPMGEVCIIPKNFKGCLGQRMVLLKPNPDFVDPYYLLYALMSPYVQAQIFQNEGSGSIVSNLRLPVLKALKIPLLGSVDQVNLGNILRKLDDKIELNRIINQELERMAKAVYDYWFVQYDFPNSEGKPYKYSGGMMVYNDILKKEIPENWEVSAFNSWISETIAGDWGKDTKEGNYTEDVYCIRAADIKGLFGTAKLNAPKRFITKKNLTKTLKSGSIVIEISGGSPTQSTGRSVLITDKMLERFDSKAICSNFCKAISIRQPYVFNFQQEWQRLYENRVFFGFEGKTSGLKNFLFDSFITSFQVVSPPKHLAHKFFNFSKSIEDKKQVNLNVNQNLSDLRDWLLPLLFSGQAHLKKSSALVSTSATLGGRIKNSIQIPDGKKAFAKQVLAGKIVSLFIEDPNFTDIKFQKIQFLAEHIIEADLNLNYYYQAAGPYDNKFMHTIHGDFLKQKWFDRQNKKFIPLDKHCKIEEYFEGYFSPVKSQLDVLFQLLTSTTEAEAEIIATIYAVWNNRIIQGKTTTDDELIADFYLWSDRKLQYDRAHVVAGLRWLIQHSFQPKGFGKLLKKAKS